VEYQIDSYLAMHVHTACRTVTVDQTRLHIYLNLIR